MKEPHLRKWHRNAGMALLVLILLQVATGLILTVENMLGQYWGGILYDIHEGLGFAGHAYRLILGAGLLWMSYSGLMIFLALRNRKKKR